MGHTECTRKCWLNGSKTKGVKTNTNPSLSKKKFFLGGGRNREENYILDLPKSELSSLGKISGPKSLIYFWEIRAEYVHTF